MKRRSLSEDRILTSALYLHTEMPVWGKADLSEATVTVTDGPEIQDHVVARALRKFRSEGWVNAEKDADQSLGPRLLYELTDESGIPMAIAAAGRELAKGEFYPISVIAQFAGTVAGQA